VDGKAEKVIDDYIKQEFPKEYNREESTRTWRAQSERFRRFWYSRVASSGSELTEDEMIPIIQILDIKGRRRTREEKSVEGVAFTNIFQSMWYDLLRGIHSNQRIKPVATKVLETNSDDERMRLLNEISETNAKIPGLTGENATIINDFMFAFDPKKNISVVSLSDRYKIINFFGLSDSDSLQEMSWGEQIVDTKQKILSLIGRLGLETDPRGLCMLLYADRVKTLWRQSIQSPVAEVKKRGHGILPNLPKHSHVVGEIINFRDMVYGPAEENGVIFLFSKITGDLGMKITSIQKRFPDAEAIKYAKNGKGYRVFIEFEYLSSDFPRHNHLEEMKQGKPCDMIVCWEHDWKECPKEIEVLELRTLLRQLTQETP